MSRLVLYYSNSTLMLMEWKNKTLLSSIRFSDEESDIESFKQMFASLPSTPVQMLVDDQEDYRRETVPHVKGKARDVVVKRLVDRFYRDEVYTSYTFQGRSEEGRKDDIILLSSLNVSDSLNTWLKVIDDMNVPLSGMWSVPMLGINILQRVDKSKDNCIVITKEADGYCRQSLFSSGQFVLSRKSRVKNNNVSEDANVLHDAIDQLYRFSTNKRVVGFQDSITVLCCLENDLFESVRSMSESKLLEFINYDVKDIVAGIEQDIGNDFSITHLYSYFCSREKLSNPQYKEDRSRSLYVKNNINKSFSNAVLFLSILMLFVSGAVAINNHSIFERQKDVQSAYESFNSSYDENFSNIQPKLDSVVEIESLLFDAVEEREESEVLPTDVFYDLSVILGEKKYKNIKLNGFKWKRYHGTEYDSVNNVFSPKEETFEGQEDDLNVSYEEEASSGIFMHILGELNYENNAYEDVVNTMLFFNDSLRSINGVKDVYMKYAPVDLRPGSKFTDLRGSQVSSGVTINGNGFEFILQLSSDG